MIKALTKRVLKKLGIEITIARRQHEKKSSPGQASSPAQEDGLLNMIAEDPLNANIHLQYSFDASRRGRSYLAYAELKTAEYLGADREVVEKHATTLRSALPDLKYMNHNQYYRFKTLSSEVITRGDKTGLSVLDIGGGQGELASFLPDDVTYCLVEPAVNGISGTNLPFPDHSFDYVVACHVLEHIPAEERSIFLDQLLSKSRLGVILLNPFHREDTYVDERLKLIIEITNAQWAKEHLACTLPKVDDIKAYAIDRKLQFCVKPNGTLTTTLAFVFVDHFAAKSGDHEQWNKINAFFNEKYTNILGSAEYPTAHLVYLGWPEAVRNVAEQITSAEA